MEKYSDTLRRLAMALDDDYNGSVLRVIRDLLRIVGELIADKCVTRDWDLRNNPAIVQAKCPCCGYAGGMVTTQSRPPCCEIEPESEAPR